MIITVTAMERWTARVVMEMASSTLLSFVRLVCCHNISTTLVWLAHREEETEGKISSSRRVEELMKSINGDVMIIGLSPHDLADDIFNIIDNAFIKHTTFSYKEDILSISIKRRRIIT